MPKRIKSLSVGIFADAEKNVELVAVNLYMSLFLSNSVENYEKLKYEYDKAVKEDQDETIIQQKKIQLDAGLMSIKIAAEIFHPLGESDARYD